jgi:hypothetical protein
MIDPLEYTPAGRLRARLGLRDIPLPVEQRDALVEQADQAMMARMGRHLNTEERELAERQTRYVAAGFNSPELGIQDLIDAGFSVSIAGRGDNAGIAEVRDGVAVGDPDVVARYQAGVAARARFEAEHPFDAWESAFRGVPRG